MSELEPLSAIADQVLDRLFAQIEENEKNFPLRKFEATDANAAFYIFIHFATLIVTQK